MLKRTALRSGKKLCFDYNKIIDCSDKVKYKHFNKIISKRAQRIKQHLQRKNVACMKSTAVLSVIQKNNLNLLQRQLNWIKI